MSYYDVTFDMYQIKTSIMHSYVYIILYTICDVSYAMHYILYVVYDM